MDLFGIEFRVGRAQGFKALLLLGVLDAKLVDLFLKLLRLGGVLLGLGIEPGGKIGDAAMLLVILGEKPVVVVCHRLPQTRHLSKLAVRAYQHNCQHGGGHPGNAAEDEPAEVETSALAAFGNWRRHGRHHRRGHAHGHTRRRHHGSRCWHFDWIFLFFYRRQDAAVHPRRWLCERSGQRHLVGNRLVLRNLDPAEFAVLRDVTLEMIQFVAIQRANHVERKHLAKCLVRHAVRPSFPALTPPSCSRRRIIPVRILVVTVPRVWLSRWAISNWVNPPKQAISMGIRCSSGSLPRASRTVRCASEATATSAGVVDVVICVSSFPTDSARRARVLRDRRRSMARLRVSMMNQPSGLPRWSSNETAVFQTWTKVSCKTSSASVRSLRIFTARAKSSGPWRA